MWDCNESPSKGRKLLGWLLIATPFAGIAVFAYLVITRWL